MSTADINLQSFQRNDEVLKLSNFDTFKKNGNSTVTNGWYMYIGKILSYLLFSEKKVFLAFSENIFEIGKESVAKCVEIEKENVFELYQRGELLLKFSYPKASENLEDDVLGFVEEEDFNWGLFLMNIVNHATRREIIFEEINKKKINE